jgi:hypothetical protein
MAILDATKNFAKATLSAGFPAGALSIVLTAGGGARMGAVPFWGVWWNATDYSDPSDDPNVEIVRVTAIVVDTLTVTRGGQGTADVNHNTPGKVYKFIAPLTSDQMSVIDAHLVTKLTGSAALTFTVFDSLTADLTFALAGAVATDAVVPAWPAALPAGICGIMFVSAANTITVRLLNLSGAGTYGPAALTYGCTIIR